MIDMESALKEIPPELLPNVIPALQILVESGLIAHMVRLNKNQLVDGRTDFDDDEAIHKEVRDIRQTNRVLLGFEESAKEIISRSQ